jgi:hypothetical protein
MATELSIGNIGYFYWVGTSITPSDNATNNPTWTNAGYTNLGIVLMSDVFSNAPAIQYHGGVATDILLSQPASFVLLLGGSTKKIAPKP